MNLIVAADKNWGIGKDNKLLVSIPSDMKFFRQETMGKVVVMGRKTLESFPNGLPLKNRTNVVLTSDKNYQVKDAVIVHSIDEVLEELKKYDDDEIYVIGGGKVYEELLPYCDSLLRRILIFRIWTRIRSGKSLHPAMNRRILIWNIHL